jgi:hypothetical protein
MKQPDFSFEKSILIQDDLPTQVTKHLVRAISSELRFEKNAVRIKATSGGWSVVLLPLQYSSCYRLIEMNPAAAGNLAPRMLRANLIQGALLFNKKVDVQLNFDFGIGKNIHCRGNDIQDMKDLGGLKL